MIKIESFLALEASLAKRLSVLQARLNDDLYQQIDELLKAKDFDEAVRLTGRIETRNAFDVGRKYIEWISGLSMLFGASRVTNKPGTSVVGLGHEKLMAHQAVDSFGAMLTNRGGLFLQAQALQLIAQERDKSIEPEVIQKALTDGLKSYDPKARVLRPFSSFMNEQGKAFFNIASSLHTSRLSAYGFTAEAFALGIEEYQINEQLDNRICPVCKAMHGRKFQVKDARGFLDVVLRVSSTEDLKSLQPWPSQSEANVEAIKGMRTEELVSKGWHIPPFHPKCRGLLTRVGKSPTMAQIESGAIPPEGFHTASREEFTAIGVPLDQEKVSAWNSVVKLSPTEVLANLKGVSLDQYLSDIVTAETKPKGFDYLSITPEAVKLTASTDNFTKGVGLKSTVMFNPLVNSIQLLSASLKGAQASKPVVKKLTQSLYTMAQDSGYQYITQKEVAGISGYEWVKMGFEPLTEDIPLIQYRLKKIIKQGAFGVAEIEVMNDLITSGGSGLLYRLALLPSGKKLLDHLLWTGSLKVDEPGVVAKFLEYIGS